jgi:hypothetical protein
VKKGSGPKKDVEPSEGRVASADKKDSKDKKIFALSKSAKNKKVKPKK